MYNDRAVKLAKKMLANCTLRFFDRSACGKSSTTENEKKVIVEVALIIDALAKQSSENFVSKDPDIDSPIHQCP